MITIEKKFGYKIETDVSEHDRFATQKNFDAIKQIIIYSWSESAFESMADSPNTVAVWKLKKLKNEKDISQSGIPDRLPF